MTDMLKFAFSQMIKSLWVSMPGIIKSYDPTTKRCRVRPAINIRKTDDSTFPSSPVVNVPVVWPSGGGFSLISPLPEGESVEILFSQRGITQFKEIFDQADPGDGIFAKEDAVVIAGFGGLTITPATVDGMSMQSDDGANYIYVENGIIKVKATTKIILDSPIVNITGIITGPNVFNGADSQDHVHPQGVDSDGDTQQDTGVAK